MGSYLKDPAARLDYSVDWASGYLEGKTVAASAWSVTPEGEGGVVVTAEAMSATRTSATLEGGLPGRVYHVTNHVTLSDGRADSRSLVLRIEAR